MSKESQNIEWKESWRDEYLKWICGFANAQGGKIYIGKNDDGEVVGVKDAKKLLEDIPNKISSYLGIISDVNLYTENGKDYIEIIVNPNLYPVSYRGEDLIFLKYLKANISYEGVTRVETYPYPKEAIREAVYNAIVHKNYATLIPIQISVYKDKIYIGNDCVFPDDWTVDNLLGKHRSRPYNPLIANTFFRAGYIESWGRGIEKIKQSCIENGNEMAQYQVSPSEVMVVFYGLHDNATQDATQDEISKRIIEYCRIPRTKKEIASYLGFLSVNGFAKRHLRPLLDSNLIAMTIPDKPNSKNQKYIAVRKNM